MQHSPEFLALVNRAKARIREISVEEVLARGSEIALIDVREDREWEALHAAGATHLGKGVIERDIESLFPEKGVQIALYCGGGYRSALAADALQEMGYHNVSSIAGGFRAWRAANAATST